MADHHRNVRFTKFPVRIPEALYRRFANKARRNRLTVPAAIGILMEAYVTHDHAEEAGQHLHHRELVKILAESLSPAADDDHAPGGMLGKPVRTLPPRTYQPELDPASLIASPFRVTGGRLGMRSRAAEIAVEFGLQSPRSSNSATTPQTPAPGQPPHDPHGPHPLPPSGPDETDLF